MSEPDALIAGRYRLVSRLGSGGMGSVWKAWDERLHRPVALKQLHPAAGMSEADAAVAKARAMREARITARLHHQHAVPVFDVVEHDGQPCLIMQFLPSRSLETLIGEKGTLSRLEVARIGAQVASALAAAHQAGIVHRDVKPANILMTEEGSAKITDFGISHALGDVALTSTGMVTGTPAYLAPEVARGEESTFASDVFSLGATLYTALEGTPPFGTDPNPMALLHRVASGEIVPPRQGGALTPVLLRMLAAAPGDRPTMNDVALALEAVVTDLGAVLAAETTRVAAPAPTRPLTGRPTSPQAGTAARPPLRPPTDRPARPHEGPPVRPHEGPPVRQRRRPRVGLLLLGLAVALALIAWWALEIVGGDGARTPAAGRSSAATTSASPSPTTSKAATTSRPPATTSAATSTVSRPTPTPTSTPAPAPRAGTPTAAELVRALRNYYALLPQDTRTGYSLLTSRYRRTTAGSYASYAAFWGAIDRVQVSDAVGSPPGTVRATLTYFFKDGRVVDERTQYGLVRVDGVLEIDSSKVLSSRER